MLAGSTGARPHSAPRRCPHRGRPGTAEPRAPPSPAPPPQLRELTKAEQGEPGAEEPELELLAGSSHEAPSGEAGAAAEPRPGPPPPGTATKHPKPPQTTQKHTAAPLARSHVGCLLFGLVFVGFFFPPFLGFTVEFQFPSEGGVCVWRD